MADPQSGADLAYWLQQGKPPVDPIAQAQAIQELQRLGVGDFRENFGMGPTPEGVSPQEQLIGRQYLQQYGSTPAGTAASFASGGMTDAAMKVGMGSDNAYQMDYARRLGKEVSPVQTIVAQVLGGMIPVGAGMKLIQALRAGQPSGGPNPGTPAAAEPQAPAASPMVPPRIAEQPQAPMPTPAGGGGAPAAQTPSPAPVGPNGIRGAANEPTFGTSGSGMTSAEVEAMKRYLERLQSRPWNEGAGANTPYQGGPGNITTRPWSEMPKGRASGGPGMDPKSFDNWLNQLKRNEFMPKGAKKPPGKMSDAREAIIEALMMGAA